MDTPSGAGAAAATVTPTAAESVKEMIEKSGDAYQLLSKLVEAAERKLKGQQDLLQILQSFSVV
jgi:dihydroxyacetone kinase-like predicted kinase